MGKLFSNVRFYVLLLSVAVSVVIFLVIATTIPPSPLRTIRFTQVYALAAILYLYLALLAGPVCYLFRFLPFRGVYLKARRAIGVSACYFAVLHAYSAFFGQLGGFAGLPFLTARYIFAISLSAIALTILFAMALTAFDWVIEKMTFKRWKILHRFVYLAGLLMLVHALMLGSHFHDLSSVIPVVTFVAVAFLFVLESLRVDAFIRRRFESFPRFGFASLGVLGFVVWWGWTFLYMREASPFGLHPSHTTSGHQSSSHTMQQSMVSMPGMDGDPTKEYRVETSLQKIIQPKQRVPLQIQVFDESVNKPVVLFQKPYEKPMHLIIVDSTLTYYTHIHPEQRGDVFSIQLDFPKSGVYHAYLDYQPVGATEKQYPFTIEVGSVSNPSNSSSTPDRVLTKQFGQYEVQLSYEGVLRAADMTDGLQTIHFTLRDARTKKPITTLQPYLASFGHLIMINTKTYDYIHVHPRVTQKVMPESTSGPTIDFLPMSMYNTIQPGIYKLFAQFNPNGELITADFVVAVE